MGTPYLIYTVATSPLTKTTRYKAYTAFA